jgi:hypothetical protein
VATVETAQRAELSRDPEAVDARRLLLSGRHHRSVERQGVCHGGTRIKATAGIGLRRARSCGTPRPCVPARASSPVNLTFEKAAVAEGAWEGAVSGDISGDLTTSLTACNGPKPCTGPIWHVEFDWVIEAGSESFTAHLSGVLNRRDGVGRHEWDGGRGVPGGRPGPRGRTAGECGDARVRGNDPDHAGDGLRLSKPT